MTKLQELGHEIKGLHAQVRAIHDEVDAKQNGEPTNDQITQVKDLNKTIEELEAKATQTREWQVSGEKSAEQAHVFAGGSAGQAQAKQIETLGELVAKDPAFAEFIGKGFGTRKANFGSSPGVEVGIKTLLTGASATSAGALIVNDRTNIVDAGVSYRPLRIMDLITVGMTDSDTVEFVRQGTHTNASAGVAEATATGNGSGSKPESAMALEVVTSAVKTIAHFLPATRQALADASQLRTLIDTFLRYGLMEELEDQIMTGAGGSDITGIDNSSPNTQAWDTDILTTIRKGRTQVVTEGRAVPTAIALNPSDWQTIDLLQDNEARYYFGGPSQMGTPRLWGLPVVESEAVTAGYGYVADWRLAALWMRQNATIYVSDSHADFFTRNMIAILAELRAAFSLIRPLAMVKCDLTA
jgi:HK97 family phage major capsid protein